MSFGEDRGLNVLAEGRALNDAGAKIEGGTVSMRLTASHVVVATSKFGYAARVQVPKIGSKAESSSELWKKTAEFCHPR